MYLIWCFFQVDVYILGPRGCTNKSVMALWMLYLHVIQQLLQLNLYSNISVNRSECRRSDYE